MPSATNQPYVSEGMPPLDLGKKNTSFFEFWPTWAMYLPVTIQWLFLSLRYRSITLPLVANPNLPLSGMVGVPKSELLAQAGETINRYILPWFTHKITNQALARQALQIETLMNKQQLDYPIVCKPDIGCRGSGVKLIQNRPQLEKTLAHYPLDASCMIQKLADYEPEAGLFYIREPNSTNGQIISLALKYTPYVMGDGLSTLEELVSNDPRAGELIHLYESRHQHNWKKVISAGEAYKLVFSASHCRGAIFKNASHHITNDLSQKIDHLMKDIPNFHYGRLDIKFKNIETFELGKHLQIVEINTASSESLHIWDANTSFFEAIRSLMFQYRTLFKFGAQNRKLGYKTPTIKELVQRWKIEKQLTLKYPETD
ncbi:D-alanine--D-alanine ligase [Reinekea sp.]|jgi:hypothetical protein|uniref:D-alanine--D-alanine ligase n=2 Tax=Reinekea sp. TaxID=1970455 RepID=UPI003988DDC7